MAAKYLTAHMLSSETLTVRIPVGVFKCASFTSYVIDTVLFVNTGCKWQMSVVFDGDHTTAKIHFGVVKPEDLPSGWNRTVTLTFSRLQKDRKTFVISKAIPSIPFSENHTDVLIGHYPLVEFNPYCSVDDNGDLLYVMKVVPNSCTYPHVAPYTN